MFVAASAIHKNREGFIFWMEMTVKPINHSILKRGTFVSTLENVLEIKILQAFFIPMYNNLLPPLQ